MARASPSIPADPVPVTVVIATRNRRERLLDSLGRLSSLPAPPALVVVDNASTDGSATAARSAFPGAEVVAMPANLGAAGRNVGARRAATECVAFSDDDSWWEAGALGRAAALFAEDRRLGLLAAAVKVGEEGVLDPTSGAMAASPLNQDLGVGPAGRRGVLGFLACGAVVRRHAFLAAGGFPAETGIGSEEEAFALKLASMGWRLVYDAEVVARHHPSAAAAGRSGRALAMARNRTLGAWMALPAADAVRATARVALRPGQWPTLAGAARLAPWALANRRPAAPSVVAAYRTLQHGQGR